MSRKRLAAGRPHEAQRRPVYLPGEQPLFSGRGPDDGIKGGAIDFVMREKTCPSGGGGQADRQEYAAEARQVTPYERSERGPLVLPEKADNMKHGPIGHLVSIRGISPQSSSHFMRSEDDLSEGEKVRQLRVW